MAFLATELSDKINGYLSEMPYMREPKGLYAPIEYVLSLGGKRIRPVLMLLAYNMYKEDVDCILPQAAGIETYHNYTLLHDDLMDKADMRRNKPTVHKVWDDNTAILSGDAMLVLAYRLMADCQEKYLKRVMDIFTQTALEICEGQQWDMEFETRTDVTVPEYIEMIRLKTSVLLSAALKIGAVLGDASEEYARETYDEYVERRKCLIDGLNRIPGVYSPIPMGAFYTVAKLPVDDADKFCAWCLEEFEYEGQTAMMAPASGFYTTPGLGKNEVRMAYVLKKEDLAKALTVLSKALEAYPGRML